MHYNGIFIGSDYLYGSVAWFDQVDPDYFSLIELNSMAELANVEGDFFLFLWPKPWKGPADGLLSIECEDDVLGFNKVRKNITLMKVYVQKLSEFEARKRIAQIKMELHRAAFGKRIRFRLEEINEDDASQVVSDVGAGTGSGSDNKGILVLQWSAPLDFSLDKSDTSSSSGIMELAGQVNPTTEVVPGEGSIDKLPNKEVGESDKGHDNLNVGFRGTEDNVVDPTVHVGVDNDDVAYTEDDVAVNPVQGGPTKDDVSVNPAQGGPMDDDVAVNPVQGGPTEDGVAVNPGQGGPTEDDVAVNPTQGGPMDDDVAVNPAQGGPMDDDVAVNPVQGGPTEDGVAVNPDQGGPTEDDVAVNPAQGGPTEDDVAVNADDGRRWLDVEEVLAEMEREEALNQPVPDFEEGWSSPTILSSSDTPGEFWDGHYNPYSSEEDSDFAYVAEQSSPNSPDYIPPDVNMESSSELSTVPGNNRAESEAGSNEEAHSDARSEDDACDRVRNEEDMINERGWGSEEEDEPRPDRYPIFRSNRDMDDAEIVIGREFETFAQFKEFCKVNAVRSRRGVKFPVNDKVRCRCVCVKECGFFLSAWTRGGSDTVVLISGQPEHDCLVEEDIRAANPSFLAKHYVARFRIDPSWSLRNFIHTVITDFGLKINSMKAYRTKKVALSLIHGEEDDQFKKLWDYGAKLRRTNPGTTVDIQYE
ncbi:hypothetical protein LINPERPRIM_LOCUS30542 [Linum perenne]